MAKRMMYLRNGMISVELTPIPDNIVINMKHQGMLDVQTKNRVCKITTCAPLLNYDGTVMANAAVRMFIHGDDDYLQSSYTMMVIERVEDNRVQRKAFRLTNTPGHTVNVLKAMGVVDDKLTALSALLEAIENDDMVTYVRSKPAIDNLLGFEAVKRVGTVEVASGELHAYPAVFHGRGVMLLTPTGDMPVFANEDEAVWAYAVVDQQLGVDQALDDATVIDDCALQLCPDMSVAVLVTWRRVHGQWCMVNPVMFERVHRHVLAVCGPAALATAELINAKNLDYAISALRVQLRKINGGDEDGA